MTHAVSVGLLVATASAFLYIGLGAWVLRLESPRRQTTLLGAFAIAFGLLYAPLDILVILDVVQAPSLAQELLQTPMGVLVWFLALALVASTPTRLEDRRLLALGVGIGAAVAVLGAVTRFVLYPPSGAVEVLLTLLDELGEVAMASALVLLPLRAAPSREPTRGDVTQLGILAVAFVTLIGFVEGLLLVDFVAPQAVGDTWGGTFRALVFVDELLLAAGLWGWNMIQAGDETVRIHRSVMLAILGLIAAGAIYQVSFPGTSPGSNVMRGVMRTLGVGLLAYGVLRHDLAGLDERVEWGVSKTTVAGAFVAVFFVVSEGAQVLFAGVVENELLGVLAAGALVFAISPLQRVADRFAAKAVPGGAEAGEGVEGRYRDALETALADGGISADEERHLGRLAERLGITAERAQAIRERVEDELEAGG